MVNSGVRSFYHINRNNHQNIQRIFAFCVKNVYNINIFIF